MVSPGQVAFCFGDAATHYRRMMLDGYFDIYAPAVRARERRVATMINVEAVACHRDNLSVLLSWRCRGLAM